MPTIGKGSTVDLGFRSNELKGLSQGYTVAFHVVPPVILLERARALQAWSPKLDATALVAARLMRWWLCYRTGE